VVIPQELGTYLGVEIDEVRAQFLIDKAAQLCESIITPLPDGGDAVVLDVAARAYSNPSNAQTQAAGPYSATFGAMGGGLWLTRQNKATLRRLAGSGGAFTIDTVPADAGAGLPWWDVSTTLGDWDVPS
jgi:hypothetical protein